MTEGKKYGLILPSKVSRNKALINPSSVFGNDDDEEDAHSAVNQSIQRDAQKTLVKKQVQLQVEKALAADPTVYEYDSIYDDLQTKKAESDKRVTSDVERKPKYIANLLKAAEQRKRELERRQEKNVQKERDAEKGLYDDKEAFVTDAYRRKMEELRAEEERERKKDEAEADVTKQSDLSGFYRNLLNERTGEVSSQSELSTAVKTEPDVQKVKVDSDKTLQEPDSFDTKSRSYRSREKNDSDSDSRRSSKEPAADNSRTLDDSDERKGHHRKHRHRHGSGDRHKERETKRSDSDGGTERQERERERDGGGRREHKRRHDSSEERDDEGSGKKEKKYEPERRNMEEKKEKVSKDVGVQRTAETDKQKSSVGTVAAPQPDLSRRTVGGTLESARERFLARKAAIKAPVIHEDSD